MKLVEVINTDETAQDVLDTVRNLCAKTRKVAVSCADRSGFREGVSSSVRVTVSLVGTGLLGRGRALT